MALSTKVPHIGQWAPFLRAGPFGVFLHTQPLPVPEIERERKREKGSEREIMVLRGQLFGIAEASLLHCYLSKDSGPEEQYPIYALFFARGGGQAGFYPGESNLVAPGLAH